MILLSNAEYSYSWNVVPYVKIMKLICPSSCLVCWNQFDWWEQIIVKVPENAGFHLDCAEKYPDNKVYTGIEQWITTPFYPDTTFEYISNK